MKRTLGVSFIALAAQLAVFSPAYAQVNPDYAYSFVDNYTAPNKKTIDMSKWAVLTGQRGDVGYFYTADNVFVRNGMLNIISRKQNAVDSKGNKYTYTSGWLWSRFRFKYGTIAFRARITTGDGVFPALWLAGDDAFPGSTKAEIDMFESVGVPTSFYSTCWNWTTGQPTDSEAATVGTGPWSHGTVVPWKINTNEWHNYGLSWKPGEALYSLDGRPYALIKKPWIANSPMRVIMNMSCGGRRTSSKTPAMSVMQIKDVVIMTSKTGFYPTYPHTPY